MSSEDTHTVETAGGQPRGRRDHHPECDKEWWTLFNDLVPGDSCPTCQALRDETGIYEFAVLEVLHAPAGWHAEEVDPSDYE